MGTVHDHDFPQVVVEEVSEDNVYDSCNRKFWGNTHEEVEEETVVECFAGIFKCEGHLPTRSCLNHGFCDAHVLDLRAYAHRCE